MSKKKGKKRNAGPPQALVRLSQVMIVKNEEKNIEQALRWARGTAFEQIVVDTGSTDRTVEIAKKMGAKIFHFEWVNDFSAAKNFAIEQASGNWIAFLDADEYFTAVNAKKLMIFLKRIMNDPQMRANYHVINCDWVNVDEEGNRMSVQDQERIFRNLPTIRYIGTIHERLDVSKENIVLVDEIEIIHTGYSETALKETNKAARNVELLRIELEKAPHDLNVKAYLADSLKMSEHQSDQEEADALFMEVIENGDKVIPDLLKKAYIHYIKKSLDNPDKADECKELCEKARRAIPGDSELENIVEQALDSIKNVPATAQQTKSKLSAQLSALKQSQQPAKSNLAAQLSALKQSADPAAAKPSAREISKSPEEQEPLKLSQCMIVKDEEENIEKALEWAKDIAFEQIVVDTGSTDRTVEIAEKMGAKVYHFEWCDDFAAAKNFAMDKASGNWIAILDADEYMEHEDAIKLEALLNKLQSSPDLQKKYDSVNCALLNLDDDGNVNAKVTQYRFFRNRPDLRYQGSIHEAVIMKNEAYYATEFNIIHTGYARTVFDKKGKQKRNESMLRAELERKPDDPHVMIYLADNIKARSTEEAYREAEQLFLKGLESDRAVDPAIKRYAYDFLLRIYSANKKKREDALKLSNDAVRDLPDNIDYRYYRGLLRMHSNMYSAAWDDLSYCENEFLTSETIPQTRVLMPSPLPLFVLLRLAAVGLADEQSILKYNTIIHTMLQDFKADSGVAGSFITALLQQDIPENEILEELASVYDFTDAKDLLIIAKEAKAAGAYGIFEKVMGIANERKIY